MTNPVLILIFRKRKMFCSFFALVLDTILISNGFPMSSSFLSNFGGAYLYPPTLALSRLASVFTQYLLWAIMF